MLLIGTTGSETRFLPEAELPECARLAYGADTRPEEIADRELAEALQRSVQDSGEPGTEGGGVRIRGRSQEDGGGGGRSQDEEGRDGIGQRGRGGFLMGGGVRMWKEESGCGRGGRSQEDGGEESGWQGGGVRLGVRRSQEGGGEESGWGRGQGGRAEES